MAGLEEEQPLNDALVAGTELAPVHEVHRSSKALQKVGMAATLALACAVLMMPWQHSSLPKQVPSKDMSAKPAFLSEALVQPAHKADHLLPKDWSAKPAFLSEAAHTAEPTRVATNVPQKPDAAVVLRHAQHLVGRAGQLKQDSDSLSKNAKDLEERASGLKQDATGKKDEASKSRGDAEQARRDAQNESKKALELLAKARQDARDMNEEAKRKAAQIIADAQKKAKDMSAEVLAKATDMKQDAVGLDWKASDLVKKAVEEDETAEQTEAKATSAAQKADTMKSKSATEKQQAIDAESKAEDETASQRMCIGLPGVKLRGESLVTYDPVAGEHPMTDDWQCNDWCLRHADCKQSVFTWETKTCELFQGATTEPLSFRESWPWSNSSYCDTADQKQNMLDMLHRVYDAKPWVPPANNCSWAGENCINTGCCADVSKCSWDFKTCKSFTCYKRDENWAGCKTGSPPDGWDGTKLGGHPNTEVAPAEDGKLVQGTKLYCFSVVMWNQPPTQGWQSSEGELANNWKEQNKGIMQCDDYSIFDGVEGGSVHNIQSFIRAWQMVKDDGRWKRNDWSIKVDPDAVFFPDHFRKKAEWQWKTPQGAAVYLRNTFYKFNFLGAIEALTREGLEIYFERGWQCEAHLGQQGGEDYWLLQCLEGLGLNYQSDFALLHDKYAADENCDDPNSVAHHFFKKTDDWDDCWNTANNAWNKEHPQ